jgi:hypothetical protein
MDKEWKPLVRALPLALSLMLAACGTFELQVGPTETLTPVEVTPQPTEAAAPSATPETAAPTATTPPAGDAVLPRAAYFLAGDGQIWRLAVDGRTLTQITDERAAVTEFDVSPVDEALVYVTENTLIRVDADGGGRTVLLTGPALTGAEGEGVTSTLGGPLWSPDGQQIAFGLNGVNLLPAAGGTPQMIQASDAVPQTRTLARFYRPYAWSPDGARLVMQVFFWQEGLVYAVKDVSQPAAAPLEITAACCEPVWSRDGQSLYFYGTDVEGYNPPGLWRVNAATGAAETLLEGRDPNSPTVRTVRYPYEAADGTLYFWMSAQTPDANFVYPQPAQYQLFALPAGATVGVTPTLVRGDSLPVAYGGAEWAENGTLVSLADAQGVTPGGPLVWVALDGGAVVEVPAEGSAPRW